MPLTRRARVWHWMLAHPRVLRVAAAVIAVLVVAGAVAKLISQAQSGAELRACQAQNIIRVSANSNSYQDWLVFRLVISEQSPQRVPPSERKAAAAFNALLTRDVSAKTWTPLTDCEAAVYGGALPRQRIRFAVSERAHETQPSAALNRALGH